MGISTTLQTLSEYGEKQLWRQVPELVRTRYKAASDVQRTISRILRYLPLADSRYGQVFWNPETQVVWAVLSPEDTEQTHQRWHNSLKAINQVDGVRTTKGGGPNADPDWIRIKKAAEGSLLYAPYEAAGRLTGGPSPLSNAIVSGLLGAGLGYGGGMVAEQLLPQRHFDKGKLRKNMALAGGLGGAALHIPQGMINMSLNRSATGQSQPFRSFFQGNSAQHVSPNEADWRSHLYNLPKTAADTGATAAGFQPVPVDAFNQAIWNDVHNGPRSSQANPYGTRGYRSSNSEPFGTPPAHAAAATGLVTGIQQMYGKPSLLSPRHFINGLAAAGIDAATATVAGGVLGTLGGLRPESQQKLQDMGIWGGLIRGVTSSVLGL